MPPRLTTPSTRDDHDLLIRIDTKVDVLQSTMQETRTALSARIDRIAQEKASVQEVDVLRKFIETVQSNGDQKDKDQDQDIKFSQRMIYIAIGATGVLEPLLLYWLMHPK